MALVKCKECGGDVAKQAKACPKCGAPPLSGISIIRILVGVAVALVLLPVGIGVAGVLASKTTTPIAAAGMSDITNKVAAEAVDQYQIAKRGNDPIQTCVQAGMVVAAFLQAKDEASFQKWQAIEKVDCAAAGVQK